MRAPWVLFEDERWADLRPLTDLLPVPALRLGGMTMAERWARALSGEWLAIEARPGPLEAWRGRPALDARRPAADDPVWAVNAAALPDATWLRAAGRERGFFLSEGRLAAARVPFRGLREALGRGTELAGCLRSLDGPIHTLPVRFLDRPWRLIEWNAQLISDDLSGQRPALAGQVHPLAALYEKERIVVEPGATVEALAVIDARGGPVRIARGARILPHTTLCGPCWVGEDTWILGGQVGASTVGPHCRIQGEVDSSIFQGHANKRHHGFVGHSWIGEWANLGALTTTSDLKNNYGPVRVRYGEHQLDSGLLKLGALLGAHVKTSIGTLLSTGCVVGSASNLFGGGLMSPKWLPPFSWWDGRTVREYRLDSFLSTARIVLSRRDLILSPGEEGALRELFQASLLERGAEGAAAGA